MIGPRTARTSSSRGYRGGMTFPLIPAPHTTSRSRANWRTLPTDRRRGRGSASGVALPSRIRCPLRMAAMIGPSSSPKFPPWEESRPTQRKQSTPPTSTVLSGTMGPTRDIRLKSHDRVPHRAAWRSTASSIGPSNSSLPFRIRIPRSQSSRTITMSWLTTSIVMP